jgi:hypothetical protein
MRRLGLLICIVISAGLFSGCVGVVPIPVPSHTPPVVVYPAPRYRVDAYGRLLVWDCHWVWGCRWVYAYHAR